MAVADQLEARLAELKQEIADIEIAIRVIRSLGEQKPTQKSAGIDAPMFAVRRTAPPMFTGAPQRPRGRRATGAAYFAQEEAADRLRQEVAELYKREARPLRSGEVIELLGYRSKSERDRVYNAIQSLFKKGVLTRQEVGDPWQLAEADPKAERAA